MSNADERADALRRAVRVSYGARARECGGGCCQGANQGHELAADAARCGSTVADEPSGCCGASGCCGPADEAGTHAIELGYSLTEISSVPEGAEMTFGCGNPRAIAALEEGQTVLDLGSGAGLDCFLAAHRVGDGGRVIGVDMTPEMIERARANARKGGYRNVEFRLGEIEHLPVADASVDVIISNCVINLSTDKRAVFREAYRVLKPGGRLAIADIVATAPIPENARADESLWCDCLGGAEEIGALEAWLREAGFINVCITPKEESREYVRAWAPGQPVADLVVSATIEAVKPA